MSDTLSPEHVARLTGRTQYAAQRRHLDKHGWIYETDASGRPVIDRQYYNSRMMSENDADRPIEPNFAALYA